MSEMILRVPAYAKINLSLAVTGVREDGMHTLRTVMQTISLCDTVEVQRAETLTFTCSEPSLAGEDNLCVKAAKAFYGATGLAEGASIRLEKKIPTGAGLGGGSSDAATVLRLLNRLYGFPLSEDALFSLAAKLGADVPFCLYGGKCLCTGVGDVLSPLPDDEERALVIAKGPGSLSTAEMYRRLDAHGVPSGVPSGVSSGVPSGAENEFEPVAIELLPEIGDLKRALTDLGGTGAQMTGSGSALFAFFPSMEDAIIAAVAMHLSRRCIAYAWHTLSHEKVSKTFRPAIDGLLFRPYS